MAEEMMTNFSESGHPVFRASNASESEELRSKEGRKKSVHFKGRNENIELLHRTLISANQLSVYGATAGLCGEVTEDLRASEKPEEAPDNLETKEIPAGPSIAETHTNAQQQ